MNWTIAWLLLALVFVTLMTIGHFACKFEESRANIIYRAESQHARLMSGDDSALYGYYPPADL